MHNHTQAYNGGRGDMSIPVLGTLDVLPKYDGHKTTLPMLVVMREGDQASHPNTGFKDKIIVDPDANPKYCKASSIPYFYREKVEKSSTD